MEAAFKVGRVPVRHDTFECESVLPQRITWTILVGDLLLNGTSIGAISPDPFINPSIKFWLPSHLRLAAPGHLAVVNNFEIVPALLGVFVPDDEGHHVEFDVEVWCGARPHSSDIDLHFWGQGRLGLDD